MASIDLDQTVTPEGLTPLVNPILLSDIFIMSRPVTGEGYDPVGDYSVLGSQLISGLVATVNISDLVGYSALASSLAGKLDASAYNNYYSGTYASLAALQAAHPTSTGGNYAIVDVGGVATQYVWDPLANEGDGAWTAGSSTGAGTTDTLAEGSTNLYFTSGRVVTVGNGQYVSYQVAQTLSSPQLVQALTNLQLNSGDTGMTASDLFRRQTVMFATASVIAGSNTTGAFQLPFPSYRLMAIQVDQESRVRIYDTAQSRDNDLGRSIGVDPGQNAGVLLEFTANANDLVDVWVSLTPTVDGFDAKASPDGLIPYTVTPLLTDTAVNVQFKYLGTELFPALP